MKVTSYLDRYGNKASGNVGTGDTLVITNGSTTKSYKVVIYGDNNGDGVKLVFLIYLEYKKIF